VCVINNPLKYTDPDGYLFAFWHVAISFIASIATGNDLWRSMIFFHDD
jgi:hypothetical protein